jgi:hypothetical protein
VTLALVPDLEHFRGRVMQDAIAEATTCYWRRRAGQFEWARPRRSDDRHRPPGLPALPASELAAAYARCTAIADACRGRAAVARLQDGRIEPHVWSALADQAELDMRAALDAGDFAAILTAGAAIEALESIAADAA